MQIEKMKLSDLKAADYNPRVDLKPGMQEYEKLKQSGNLVGGHQRVAVAKELGLFNEIEVSVVDLPLDKEKALNKLKLNWANYGNLVIIIYCVATRQSLRMLKSYYKGKKQI